MAQFGRTPLPEVKAVKAKTTNGDKFLEPMDEEKFKRTLMARKKNDQLELMKLRMLMEVNTHMLAQNLNIELKDVPAWHEYIKFCSTTKNSKVNKEQENVHDVPHINFY